MQLFPGMSIGNERSGSDPGTLGCFVVLRSDPSAHALLSNNHVVFNDGPGARTSPPVRLGHPNAGSCRSCCPKNIIARATLPGREENANLPVRAGIRAEVFVDCAIARLEPGMVGVNQVNGLGGDGMLSGWTDPVEEQPVVVVTRRGLVPGTIEGVDVQQTDVQTGQVKRRQISIRMEPGYERSAQEGSGDSGSVVVDAARRIVALVHSAGRPGGFDPMFQDATHYTAVPIRAVLEALQIDMPPVPSIPHAGRERYAVPPPRPTFAEPLPAEFEPLRAFERRLRASGLGRELVEAGYRHGPEIARLVHHCRPVMVAWHRGHGPAWSAHLLNALREREYSLPAEVRGVSQRALLERMREVLDRHGSEALRAGVALHGPTVLALAGASDAEEVFRRIEAGPGLRPAPA